MNNGLRNNHSSQGSNKYIANRRNPRLKKINKESNIKDIGMLYTQLKENKTNIFDIDNGKSPVNIKDLIITRSISKHPTNYVSVPNTFSDNVIYGYFISAKKTKLNYNNATYPTTIRKDKKQKKYLINEDGYKPRNKNYFYLRKNLENDGYEIKDKQGSDGEEEHENHENENEYDINSPSKIVGNYNQNIGDGIVRNNSTNL